MNYDYICEKEGYRREDLTKEHQEILSWLDDAKNEIECCKDRLEDYDEDIADGNMIGKIKEEFASGLIDCLLQDFESWIKGVQISFRDSEVSDE